MRVRLTGHGGQHHVFEVVTTHLNTETGELRMLCRDRMEAVLQVENVEVLVTDSLLSPQSSDEIRRAMDVAPLVMEN